jgi:hypothetical protein
MRPCDASNKLNVALICASANCSVHGNESLNSVIIDVYILGSLCIDWSDWRKVKAEAILLYAMKAPGGRGDIAHSWLQHYMGVSGQCRVTAAR